MSEANDKNTTQKLVQTEPVQKTPSPTPEKNMVSVAPLLSPQDIRPFPKAPQKKTVLNKRKRKTAILTDTPIKNKLAEEQKMRKIKPKVPKKKKVHGKKKKQPISSSEEDECDDVLCLICCEPWSASKPNEEWVQYTKCKLWAHTKCGVQNVLFYSCPNCASEDESDRSNSV